MSPNKRVFGVKEHNSKEHKSKHFYIHIKKLQYQKPTNTLPQHMKKLCYKQLPTQAIREGDKRRFFHRMNLSFHYVPLCPRNGLGTK